MWNAGYWRTPSKTPTLRVEATCRDGSKIGGKITLSEVCRLLVSGCNVKRASCVDLVLYLLIGETMDGEDLIAEGEAALEPLDAVEDDGPRSLLGEMLRLNPWERPSSDEVARRLASLHGGAPG